MAKSIPGVPESLTREQFLSIFAAINVDPHETTELHIMPEGISVTVIARNSLGQMIPGLGKELAKHKVFIPVRNEEEGK